MGNRDTIDSGNENTMDSGNGDTIGSQNGDPKDRGTEDTMHRIWAQ